MGCQYRHLPPRQNREKEQHRAAPSPTLFSPLSTPTSATTGQKRRSGASASGAATLFCGRRDAHKTASPTPAPGGPVHRRRFGDAKAHIPRREVRPTSRSFRTGIHGAHGDGSRLWNVELAACCLRGLDSFCAPTPTGLTVLYGVCRELGGLQSYFCEGYF